MIKTKNVQILIGYTQIIHWMRLYRPQLYHCVVKGKSKIKFTEMPGRYYNLYIVSVKVNIDVTEETLSWPIRLKHVKPSVCNLAYTRIIK